MAELTERESKLSRRLQQVARFFVNNPEDVAIHTIVELARQAGVQPSAITRFAKEMGFAGFNSLQSVFRQRLLGPRMTYDERMKSFADAPRPSKSRVLHLDEPSLVFDTFVQAAMDTLIRLREDVDRLQLQGFVDVLAKSGAVHILGARGAYGVATYCYYSLSRVGKRAHLIDNVGSMREQQLAAVDANDVLLVLTFDDYTPETIEIAQTAHQKGRTLLVITDNELSPVARLGTHTLFVKEARLGHFRSQVPAMVLCQSIIISLGKLIERA
ncbi:MurR/RpiR family transcriptional regulator [Devosia sp. UYZn731]|uniref:MurR/RpiR family transcriptional regulator n=1 Tax=Devosia sp. UYZn731 TaxID=3156345 RepID=UPI003399E26A